MKLSPKFLKKILADNREFFENEILTDAQLTVEFDKRKSFFDNLYVRDLIGYIPASLNEPSLKIFQEYGEVLERWLLWQSWYMQRASMKNPARASFYDGAMLYIRVLHTMASTHKKSGMTVEYSAPKPDKPWVEKALTDLEAFSKGMKEHGDNKRNQASDSEITENNENADRKTNQVVEG